ncbi:discoidin domain-containing protein [Pedobacter hiemivivus]|uniref:Discoidin domain-containing protein n=1 Tax=Pedobacter hiemivivus TaxID=2530454 RepID=A0A4U1G216_9SPHI|nr:discoidin domain-containing protein [Pedobacter hiemivivus]TKC57601.1 discoidin domain-containing protein [Pedobacter hiemivivus]
MTVSYTHLKQFLYFTLVCIVSMACSNTGDKPIEQALMLAGSNRPELERVLDHYHTAKDSLKYKAACFLIENMPSHQYDEVHPKLFHIMDSLNRSQLSTDSVYKIFDSTRKTIPTPHRRNFSDIKTLSYDFLISHIDASFDAWYNAPWREKITFENFCEYILPYSESNEKRELWISYYRSKYGHYLNNYANKNKNTSIQQFCELVNGSLIHHSKIVLYQKGLRNYPPTLVDNIRSGSCEEYKSKTIYLMRSLGLPVGTDFSPQWINFNSSHTWNILIGDDGKKYPFLGFDEKIKDWHIESTFHCPKVFRKTYSIQKESLAQQNVRESLPGFLKSPNLKDVSEEYFPVCDVDLNLENSRATFPKVAYLCVFDNKRWVPVHWGLVKGTKVKFSKMGKGLIYLPAYYINNEIVAAAAPFILDTLGKISAITVDTANTTEAILTRKYYTIKVREYPKRMLNGRFQGANDPGFKKPEDLYSIKLLPKVTFNKVKTNIRKKFRYVRYIGGPRSFTNVAEIEFYTKERGILSRVCGDIIGTPGSYGDKPEKTKEKALDGDVLSFFDALVDSGAWVGYDLKLGKTIDEIHFLPKNDDNNIRIGDVYELLYWNDGQWNTLGARKANTETLVYNNCPQGALFLLHNHTRGKEERIFLLQNGKQVWW